MNTYSHLLPNEPEVQRMLKELGLKSVDELFTDIPEETLLRRPPDLPGPLSQQEIERLVEERLSGDKTHPDYPCFLGGGMWLHYVPPAVRLIAGRSEFYTSYTPYQPEISQGVLQSLFEYQSVICELGGMDAANASMYDWPSAAAEAVRMAMRVTGRKKLIVSEASGPERKEVIRTYAAPIGGRLVEAEFNRRTGETEAAEVDSLLGEDVAAVYIEQPNFFGVIERSVRDIAEAAHRNGSLLIVGAEPISLGILEAPGSYGADIMVGEGQPLGIPLSYGGPSLGIFAVKGDLSFIRQMPGRIIGMTEQKGGGRGFVMVLQTREQHIRREKATSNICTNQALMAIMAVAYVCLLGKDGFSRLARTVASNSHYVARRISELDSFRAPHFDSEFFSDFAISHKSGKLSGEELYRRMSEFGVHGPLPVGWFYPELRGLGLVSVTEACLRQDIEKLVMGLREVGL
jgi:glycine dehydrogenase subunit 1